MATEITFRVEEYTDINSNNKCEVFSVYTTNEIEGVTIKTKVWERDYGSQTQSMDEYILDFFEIPHNKETKPKDDGGWISTATY